MECRSTRVRLQELLKSFLYIILLRIRWSWLKRNYFLTSITYDNVRLVRQPCQYVGYIY